MSRDTELWANYSNYFHSISVETYRTLQRAHIEAVVAVR